ncbi:flagellar biosynthesis anti-sigma factor FlgM [Thermocrinis sp.]|uniref:flagellar biosynthesis anti-sigma factor FlgM n=1 Tax=Thermocrinis sp. TaxID=2024383 RepID=UPI002FDE9E52
MINRVNLQKFIDGVLNQEKTTSEKSSVQEGTKEAQAEGVKVELSEVARNREKRDLSELEKKVSEIRSSLERNEYKVDAEKIFEGLTKFLSISDK